MSKEQVDAVDALLRERAKNVPGNLQALREEFARFTAQLPVPGDVAVDETTMGGMPGLRVTPEPAGKYVVLYLHGGGYVLGSPRTHLPILVRLATAAGAAVWAPDYRLAPEHPFPAAVDDAVTAYRWLLEHGHDHKRIAIAGDSAGGGLVIATLVALRDRGLPLPAAGYSISPWTDLTCTGGSMRAKASVDPLITKAGAILFANIYLNGADPESPLASPLYADLAGLPPILIQVGEREVLLDDAIRIAQRLRDDGVDVCYELWDDMIHVWHLFAHRIDEGQQALETAAAWLKKTWRAAGR